MVDAARALVALAIVALVALAAVARARARRAPYAPPLPRLPEDALPAGLRAPLSVVYFTSRLCGACRETPGVVREAAPEVPSFALSVHDRPDLVRALDVRETPTLLLVDDELRIRYARVGNPEPAELWTYVREAWDSLDAEGRLARVPA